MDRELYMSSTNAELYNLGSQITFAGVRRVSVRMYSVDLLNEQMLI